MMLGLVFAGKLLGTLSALAWILAGGSVVTAVALYGLVGTFFVLSVCIASYVLTRRDEVTDDCLA